MRRSWLLDVFLSLVVVPTFFIFTGCSTIPVSSSNPTISTPDKKDPPPSEGGSETNYDYVITDPQYGVTVDDGLPDAAAIEAALAQMPDDAIVFFPKGQYDIDQPIRINNNNLTLLGEDGTWLKAGTHDYYADYAQKRVGVLNLCADNITIDTIGVDQNFRGSGRVIPATALIGGILIGCSYTGHPVSTENITIKNSSVYDYYGDGISAWNVPVTNFTVDHNTLTSTYIVQGWTVADSSYLDHGEQGINVVLDSSNINFTNNTILGALDDAIAVHANVSNVNISGNTITTTGGRILVDGTTNGVIDNNHITYIEYGSTAILLGIDTDYHDLSMNNGIVVSNNVIDALPGVRIAQGIRLYGPGSNIEVYGNQVSTSDLQAIGIQMNSADAYGAKQFGENISIHDNVFDNFKIGIQQNTGIQGYVIQYSNNQTPNCEKSFVNLDI